MHDRLQREKSAGPRPARRDFLRSSAAALGSGVLAGAFQSFLGRSSAGKSRAARRSPLQLLPTRDQATGLKLLRLPDGFRYVSYGWCGDEMSDGARTPGMHDGMAVIHADAERLTLCRNHEVKAIGQPFGSSELTYDPHTLGGCTQLVFDTRQARWIESRSSLAGTLKNCAGGPTPWGSWLSCEETVLSPGEVEDDIRFEMQHEHGWIFEVPVGGARDPVPLKDMGRFVHEAVAIDPETLYVYETEDRDTAGFYRFLPHEPGVLQSGGRLQMLRVLGRSELMKGCTVGRIFETTWVDIDDPYRAHSPGTRDQLGVMKQGKAKGATSFARLEGCWFGNDLVYLVSTSGGDAESGQVWSYDPRSEQLRLVFESPAPEVLDSPDNLAVSPRGGIVLCEDGELLSQRLHGLTRDGRIFPLAVNNVVLRGEKNGIEGDFRMQEWCGACFSPDGQWLFANLQTPGITLAITGPWQELGL